MASQNTTREPLNRDVIVQHTLTLIENHGIAGFRLKDLAGRLDVTIPNLYRHFKNRDDIVYSALADDYIAMCAAMSTRINDVASRLTTSVDLLTALRRSEAEAAGPSLTRRRTTRLQALAAVGGHERSDEIQSALHNVHVAIENLYVRAQKEGLVDEKYSARVLTLITSSMLTGIAVTEVDPLIASAEDNLWDVLAVFLLSLRPTDRVAQ